MSIAQQMMMAAAGGAGGGGEAEGWNLATATYDSVSFSVSGQDTVPRETAFKPDGTKMYLVGASSDAVHQYSLSTAWDLSTASYDSVSFSVSGQDTNPQSLFFKPDGTKMYVLGSSTETVRQYSLSTAWDLSTASYDGVSFSIVGQQANSQGIFFKPDGANMYISGSDGSNLHQYSLSTAWDLSTASYDSVSFSVSGQATSPASIYFKPDGLRLFVLDFSSDTIYQYSVSTAWSLVGVSYDAVSFNVAAQESLPFGITFKPDGTKMYLVGLSSDTVYQYSLTD